MEPFIDLHLGVPAKAWALLHLLSAACPDFFDKAEDEECFFTDTFAWYNGRHRGFSIVLTGKEPSGPCLIVAFGEHPQSDMIMIDVWEQRQIPYHTPTIEQREREVGDFQGGGIERTLLDTLEGACTFIVQRMTEWTEGQS